MMTFSEFGRRPEENGDGGTDHGTAAPHFVIGDHVKGGLHGTQPSLTKLDNDGNFVPAVDFRQMYAPILKTWLGVDDHAVLGKTYTPLGLFTSGPGVPPRRVVAGYVERGLLARGPDRARARLRHRDEVQLARARRAARWSPARDTPTRQGAVARGFRRRDLQLRRRQVLRLDRRHPPEQADRRDGRDADRQGLLALRQRRRHLRLRRRQVLRLHRRDPPQQADRRDGRRRRRGKGYWLCASDGGIFAYGDAKFYGSTGAIHLNKPIVGDGRVDTSGKGYWLCASDGGIFNYGDAKFHGATMPDHRGRVRLRALGERQRLLDGRRRRHRRRVRRRVGARQRERLHVGAGGVADDSGKTRSSAIRLSVRVGS